MRKSVGVSPRERLKEALPAPMMMPVRTVRALALGRFSRTLSEARLRRSAANPRTFNQLVLQDMAHDRNPLRVVFADKIRVRDYVAGAIGDAYLANALAVGTTSPEIPWSDLPDNYVAKVNHGCGGIVFVSDAAPEESEVPRDPRSADWGHVLVQRRNVDPGRLRALFDRWLSLDYSWSFGRRFPEWSYRDVPRGILVEERLWPTPAHDRHSVSIYVVNGRVPFIRHRSLSFGGERRTGTYDGEWQPLPVRFKPVEVLTNAPEGPLPQGLQQALHEIALALAEPVPLVRVDLYTIGSRIVFGELTNHPACGQQQFTPQSFDEEIFRRITSCI
jgi:hypothetical protein